jgi:predicted N-acyltransferase
MIEIITTMKDIEKKDWNALVKKDKVETSYEWFCFAEDICVEPEHDFCHSVCTDEKGTIQGIMPAYTHHIYVKNFVRESGLRPIQALFPKIKTPLKTTRAHIPLSCDFRYFGNRKYFNECLTGLENFTKKENHFLFVIRDSNERLDLPDYFCIELYPEAYIDPYPSWDAYLQSQKGKRGKHIRYEYKKSVNSGTKTYIQEDLHDYSTVLYDLYVNVCEKNKGVVDYPQNFFEKMEEHLPEYTKCIFAQENGNITAYLYILENEYCISCKFAGRTYEEKDPYVYFRLLYELIKYAIKKKKPISAEKATYEAKLRRGFKAIEKRNYYKTNYPLLGELYFSVLNQIAKKRLKSIQKVKAIEG